MQETFPWRIIQRLCYSALPHQQPTQQLPFMFFSQTLFTREQTSPTGPTPNDTASVEVTWVYVLILFPVEFPGGNGCRNLLS